MMEDAVCLTTGRGAVRWPPRVHKAQLRRLYASIPTDQLDEKLVDDVGISLYMRCQAIITISKARHGQVLCPVCDRAGREQFISRRGHAREELIHCPQCGWEITWADYQRTFKRKQFNEGGAGEGFRRYLEHYPKCRTPWEKMLAIDLLIHEFHYSLRNEPDRPTWAACVNLIEGRLADVVRCLNEISGVTGEHPELTERHRAWKAKCIAAGNWHPK